MTRTKKNKVALVSNNEATHSTASIFSSLEATLCHDSDTITDTFYSPPSKSGKIFKAFSYLALSLRNSFKLRHYDIAICHTMALRNFPIFVLKRALGYKVGLIIWDIYPESFEWHEIRLNKCLFHVLRFAERACICSADFVIVPSEDYLVTVRSITKRRVVILPLSHQRSELLPVDEGRGFDGRAIEIGFGGQVNAIRGFPQAITILGQSAGAHRLVVHVFTSDEQCVFEKDLPDNVTVVWHGFLCHNDFKAAMSALDAGIVSLSPDFNLPAFPSKTIDYVEFALPILYVGPDLPAYVDLLTRTGIGAHVRPENDLTEVLLCLQKSFSKKRENFLNEVSKPQKDIRAMFNL